VSLESFFPGPVHFAPEPDFSGCRHMSERETIALLTAVESAALASRMLKSGKFGEARCQELRQLVERGIRARDELVDARRWHAEYLARRFGRPHEVEDLTQEALLALLRAIMKFDLQAAFRFDRYAEIRMHEAVRHALARDPSRRRERRDAAA